MKKIVNIKKSKKQEVFDLTVNNNRNFITRGAVLHNCDFRGLLSVKLAQDSSEVESYYIVEVGDRIAQGMIMPVEKVEFLWVEELSDTERGEGGFHSTGR